MLVEKDGESAMSQRILGLDLGAYSVTLIGIEPKGRTREFEVVSYLEEPLVPAETAEETTLSTLERYEIALSALKEKDAFKNDLIVTGVPGEAAAVRFLRFPFSDPKKIEQALPFELESEIPYDIEDVIYSWTILSGKSANDAECEVLVAFSERETVRSYLDLFERVGLDPRHIRFDSLALADCFQRSLFGPNAKNESGHDGVEETNVASVSSPSAVAIVDIGHSRTNISIVTAERLFSAQTMLHGGDVATRALAKELGISLEEAERGKSKEAFIEVQGAVAQFDDQAKVSDILKKSYRPIAQRLRQVFLAVRSQYRVNVNRIVLLGGGSGILNLEHYFAETLQIRVQSGRELLPSLGNLSSLAGSDGQSLANDHAEGALALSFAMSALPGGGPTTRIDFRTGEFGWKGDLDFLRERFVALGAWAAVLLMCFAFGGGARAFILSNEADDLRAEQEKACESITGQKIDSASRCLAIIQERIQAQQGDSIPEWSAVDTFLEVSRRMPPVDETPRKVTELDISDERVRLKITTSDFDGVDQIVNALQKGKCFASVEKGKARNIKDGVGFNPQIKIDCDKAPGEAIDESAQQSQATMPKAKSAAPVAAESAKKAAADIAPEPETRSAAPASPAGAGVGKRIQDNAKSRREAIRASIRARSKNRDMDEEGDEERGPQVIPRRRGEDGPVGLPVGLRQEQNKVAPRPVPRNLKDVVRGLREVPSRPVEIPGRSVRRKLDAMPGRGPEINDGNDQDIDTDSLGEDEVE